MHTVRIQTTIGVPIERGFAAWTEAEHLSQWFTERAEIDLREGGSYGNSDGDRGTFLLIRPNNRLRFTWENPDHAPGTVVEIEFTGLDDRRHSISLTHSGLGSEAEAGAMETGWSWGLASLRSYLESGRPIPFDEWERERNTEPLNGSPGKIPPSRGKLVNLTPMLVTTDVRKTVEFYVEILGFDCGEIAPDGEWAAVSQDGVELMFRLPDVHIPFKQPMFTGSFYFRTDRVDELWEDLRERVRVCYPIEDFHYGMREFAVYDVNGYILQFGKRTASP